MFRCANRPTTALSLTLSRFCAQNCLSASVVIHSDFWLLAPSSVFLFLYVLRNKLKQLMRHDDQTICSETLLDYIGRRSTNQETI